MSCSCRLGTGSRGGLGEISAALRCLPAGPPPAAVPTLSAEQAACKRLHRVIGQLGRANGELVRRDGAVGEERFTELLQSRAESRWAPGEGGEGRSSELAVWRDGPPPHSASCVPWSLLLSAHLQARARVRGGPGHPPPAQPVARQRPLAQLSADVHAPGGQRRHVQRDGAHDGRGAQVGPLYCWLPPHWRCARRSPAPAALPACPALLHCPCRRAGCVPPGPWQGPTPSPVSPNSASCNGRGQANDH